MHRQTDRRTDGRMDGRTDEHTNSIQNKSSHYPIWVQVEICFYPIFSTSYKTEWACFACSLRFVQITKTSGHTGNGVVKEVWIIMFKKNTKFCKKKSNKWMKIVMIWSRLTPVHTQHQRMLDANDAGAWQPVSDFPQSAGEPFERAPLACKQIKTL